MERRASLGPDTDAARSLGRAGAAAGLLAAAVAVLVFLPTVWFGFVNWDDGIFVYENPLVTAPAQQPLADRLGTPHVGYPIPLTIAVYGVVWAMGVGAAGPFHVLNVLVHALNAGLLVHLLRRRRVSITWAGLAGLAFALHPVVVEPVAWVTGLKDLLMTLGVALALLAFERSDEPGRGVGGTAAAGVAALLAKPTAVVVGPVLAAFAWFEAPAQGGGERERERPAWRWAVAAALTLLGVAFAVWTMGQESPELRTRAQVPFSIVRVVGALGLAVQHLLAPATLSPVYGVDQVGVMQLALALVGLLGLGVLAWRRPASRPWLALAGLAWLPVSNLLPLERFTADSYLYLPWFGLCGAFASGLGGPMAESAESAESAEPDEPTTLLRLAPVGTLAIVAVWGLLSVLGSRAWQSDRALWAAAYEVRPEDPRVILRLGDALGRAGEGRAEYALYLEHLDALEHAEEVPVALPVYLERSGDVVAAEAWYATAFAKPTKQPEGLYTHYLEFIARHPERHDPNRDDVLRYALPGYLGSERAQQLGLAELAELQRHAARLGIRRQRSTGPT